MLRHDGAGVRAKLMQGLMLQALLAGVILLFAFLSRDEPRTLALSLWTIVVPAGFSYGYWSAATRSASARAARTWTPQMEAAEAKRLVRVMGTTIMVWIAGLAALWLALS